MFYLSPATSKKQFKTLQKKLRKVILRFIINNIGDHVCDEHSTNVKEGVQVRVDNCITQCNPASVISQKTEWIALENTENRICAANCGLFPPCTPLIKAGERVEKEKIELLQRANNVYGLDNGKMLVIKTEKEE
jgi:arginine/lysine/ornithine decarboxylase